MSLTFDSGRHEYRLDGEIIPGISQLLRAAGLLGDVERLPAQAREAGTARHAWIEADLHGRLNPRKIIPEAVRPWVYAARAALRDTGARVLGIELLVLNRAVPYATKLDALVSWREGTWIWDWKTGGAWPSYPAQLALAALCLRERPRRACIFLNRRGRYRIEEHADPHDYTVAADVIRRWKSLQQEPKP